MKELKVIQICQGDHKICFSVEPENGIHISKDHLQDVVENAILEAKSHDGTFPDIVTNVSYELNEEGYLVRDMPFDYETLTYQTEEYEVSKELD